LAISRQTDSQHSRQSNPIDDPERWQPLADYLSAHDIGVQRVSVVVHTPDGDRFAYQPHESFFAASTIKVPVAVELLRRIDRGELSLGETYEVQWRNIELGEGTDGTFDLEDGIALPLREMLYMMITMSDNEVANVLFELAGMDTVNRTMRELGLRHTVLGRFLNRRIGEVGERENWTTAADLALLMDAIVNDWAASAESCKRLRHKLVWQPNMNRIGYHFKDWLLPWGTKTGTVGAASHDAGFIRGECGIMTIAVCTHGFPSWRDAEPAIAEITRLAAIASGILPNTS
jgi:beta-lactamase class A